jgi:hypothetical protein
MVPLVGGCSVEFPSRLIAKLSYFDLKNPVQARTASGMTDI